MSFQKMRIGKYPIRLWAVVGYPGAGKSSFAARMRSPILPIDADHRFGEVAALADEVFELSNVPADNTDPDRIAQLLGQHMPETRVGTIVVDSLTAIIAPYVVQAMVDKDAGHVKNLYAAFRDKALAMRQLQDAVTKWGCDTLWVWHLNDARDASGKETTKATVSATEVIRLTRSINMTIEIVVGAGEGTRGVKVVWARRGRSGMTLWDDSGTWQGMPEKIEAAVYDGLTSADQDRIEMSAPEVFASPEVAIDWAIEQGAFESIPHARNAYEKLRREAAPKTARAMAALWIADVQRRLAEKANGNGHGKGE